MIARLRALRDDRRGTSLIEFAILMPVMLLLFLGGYQLSDASACKRRVTIVTRAVADMVSQSATISPADVDGILNAATAIIAPYPLATATIRVSEVVTDAKGANPKVVWSRGRNVAPLAAGTAVAALPTAMRMASAYYIYSEMTYGYVPIMDDLLPPITFTQSIFMLPRKSSSVDLTS